MRLGLGALAVNGALWAALGLAASPAHAQTPLVMNFDGQSIGRAPSTFTQNGIKLVSSNNSVLFNAGNPAPGYDLNADSGTFTFTLASGGSFAFDSLDLATNDVTLTFTGTLASGGTVTDTRHFVNSNNGFVTYRPPATFVGLTSFTMTDPPGGGTLGLDNVTLTPNAPTGVPEPSQTAALGLGALGVLGLMVRARRRKSA